MNLFETDVVHLHYRDDGDPKGAPVVFANSLGTDLRLWDKVVEGLPQGLRLIRYDMRGHGLTDALAPPYSMGALISDAEALLIISPCAIAYLSGYLSVAWSPKVLR